MKTQKQNLVTTCALADVGRVRTQQQDSLGYVNLPHDRNRVNWAHLYVVADGVGGAEAGGLASALAVQTIIDQFYQHPSTDIEEALLKAISQANQKILQESEKRHIHRMHTTVACAAIHGQQLYVAHVGDSRAYLMRSGKLERLTKDHSKVQTLIDAKKLTEEEARTYRGRNLITRALGDEPDVEPDISRHDIHPNDLLLLCSDGLHGELRDEEIASILQTNSNLKKTCEALVQQAKSSGGKDNISLILTRIGEVEEIGNQSKAKVFPPKAREIRQLSHTILASPLSDSIFKILLGKMRQWRKNRFALAMLVIAIYFCFTFGTILWFQQENQKLRANLEHSQEILLETESSLESLILDYEQGMYGSVDDRLKKKMDSIQERLNEGKISPKN